MKKLFIIIGIFTGCSTFAQVQVKDTRAKLDFNGNVGLSVSPAGKMWLTVSGEAYYAEHFDSNWHKDVHNFRAKDRDHTHIHRISFFNRKTAIMTGSISADGLKKNGLFLTKDAGNNWDLVNFGGNEFIYDVFLDPEGNAWIGGSGGNIYYSPDFGERWEKLNSPLNSFDCMESIFMLNKQEGVTGGLSNKMYTTSDNWKSSKKIETPLDQGLYQKSGEYPSNKISKLLIWNNYIIAEQGGHIFYTSWNDIKWKPFPVKVRNYCLDQSTGLLYGISDSLQVLVFQSTSSYKLLSEYRFETYPKIFNVVNGSIYGLIGGWQAGEIWQDYEVHRLNAKEYTQHGIYTTDRPIPEPEKTIRTKHFVWGLTFNELYISENGGIDWYREKSLNFIVIDIKLLNDSSAILWSADGNNYLYTLSDHRLQRYYHINPLKSFLETSILDLLIISGNAGCFHRQIDQLQYESINDSIMQVALYSKQKNIDVKSPRFKNFVNSQRLSMILMAIDSNPQYIPSIHSFGITEEDKEHYLEQVMRRSISPGSGEWRSDKPIDVDFYEKIPSIIDTMGEILVKKVLDRSEDISSTTSCWLMVRIINANHDTITVSRQFYNNSTAWHIPWELEYKDQYFQCYSLEFSKFIYNCLPAKFMYSEDFDNAYLLMNIADYLYPLNK